MLTQPTGSKIYRVDFDSRLGLPYVEFPDDIANIIGNGLDISYISTSGTIGNVKANSLIKVKSPTDFVTNNDQEVSLENDFTISNQSSILNGKDPETINEMYQSFKRIVGTFDTLVTRRDYENAIKEMEDDYSNNLVSNVAVTDVRTDYNNIINIVTFDEYGVYYENASLTKGITSYNFVDAAAVGYTPSVGDIKYDTNKFMVCTDADEDNPTWEEINSIGYKDFVAASETMTPYDLAIYALKTFSMADYLERDPGLALNKSFTQVNGITQGTIESELNNYKCINHTFKDPETDDIFCFKNYVPLNITIIPYSKVTREEKDEIIRNIYRALTENFNASKVEFGEELNYDEVVDVLLASDTRIKNIRLEDFEYIPVAMYADATDIKDGTEEKVYEKPELLVDLIAKNVLAGRVCLFDFDETFAYTYGQVGSEYFPNIGTLSTEVEIEVPEEPVSGGVEGEGEEIYQVPSSFSADVNGLIIQMFNGSTKVDAWSTALAAGQDYTLPEGYTLTADWEESDIQEHLDFPETEGNTVKIHANSNYTYNPDVAVQDPTSISIIEESSSGSSDNGSLDFQYELKENEYIEIIYPNYYSTIIYPTYCNYRFVSPNNTTVYSNTDYKLQDGEYLYIMYSNDDEQQYVTYKKDDVIKTTFNMTPTSESTKGSTKSFGPNGVKMLMSTLGSGQQIEIREKLETKLSGRNIPCYWIMNNGTDTLFKEIDDDITQVGEEGYSWVILESGEYFIYSNSNLDSMVILGAGTKITRSDNDKSQWTIESTNTTIESISTNGFNSNITWQYKDFSINNLIIQELNVVTLGNTDQVSVIDWSGDNSSIVKPTSLNNKWQDCGGTIYYKINGKQTSLKKLNLEDGYQIRSRLDLVTDKYNGQKLLSGDGSQQTIKVKYFSGAESVITPDGGGSSSSETSELYVQSTVPLDLIGSENMNIDLITSNTMLNFMTYQKNNPKVYTVNGSQGYSEEEIQSDNGKYVISIEGAGYAEFPFTYDNYFTNYDGASREYVLPVFISGDKYSNPITASFIVDRTHDPDSSSGYTPIPDTSEGIEVLDYNHGSPASTLTMNNKELYLVTPVVPSGLTYEEGSTYDDEAPTPFEEAYIKGDLILRLEWDDPQGVEIITVYDPKIIRGVNDGIAAVSSVVTMGDVLDRMDYLVAHSNKPNVKPYYINEPEQSIAIQDPDFSNPNIFWDKNNVANLVTIPQIIIPSDNIDIIKSMKGYSLKEEGK
ncbi:MAG: hypothetical protein IJH65_03350 [Methanobrevibacter sp.]|nr:hypothetical protein [Methanobrevibacter sp.]